MIRNEKYEIRCHPTTATSDIKIKKPEKRDNLRALLSVGKCSLDFFFYTKEKRYMCFDFMYIRFLLRERFAS